MLQARLGESQDEVAQLRQAMTRLTLNSDQEAKQREEAMYVHIQAKIEESKATTRTLLEEQHERMRAPVDERERLLMKEVSDLRALADGQSSTIEQLRHEAVGAAETVTRLSAEVAVLERPATVLKCQLGGIWCAHSGETG